MLYSNDSDQEPSAAQHHENDGRLPELRRPHSGHHTPRPDRRDRAALRLRHQYATAALARRGDYVVIADTDEVDWIVVGIGERADLDGTGAELVTA